MELPTVFAQAFFTHELSTGHHNWLIWHPILSMPSPAAISNSEEASRRRPDREKTAGVQTSLEKTCFDISCFMSFFGIMVRSWMFILQSFSKT